MLTTHEEELRMTLSEAHKMRQRLINEPRTVESYEVLLAMLTCMLGIGKVVLDTGTTAWKLDD